MTLTPFGAYGKLWTFTYFCETMSGCPVPGCDAACEPINQDTHREVMVRRVDIYARRGDEGPFLVERGVDAGEADTVRDHLEQFGWEISVEPNMAEVEASAE